jgi:hypothetical protein
MIKRRLLFREFWKLIDLCGSGSVYSLYCTQANEVAGDLRVKNGSETTAEDYLQIGFYIFAVELRKVCLQEKYQH